MGDAINEPVIEGTASKASARVICEEFLKVLSRKEVEQPMICQNLCLCAQFWRYQHYLLPRWDWGITKFVCLDLGSFRNTQPNGGPFPSPSPSHPPTLTAPTLPPPHHPQHPPQKKNEEQEPPSNPSYATAIRDPALRARFNTRPLDACDALQTMLRHAAAVEVAAALTLCSSRRGIEHGLVKMYFKRLTGLSGGLVGMGVGREEGDGGEGSGEKETGEGEHKEKEKKGREKKSDKLPPIAGYAGDPDLVDVPVYFCGEGYTGEDRQALAWAAEVMHLAQLPPVEVVGGGVDEVCRLVDRRTLVYTVGLDCGVWREVLRRCKPAAVIAGACVVDSESRGALDDYEEFKLDKGRAPHTIGSSHLYIRKDIVDLAEREAIVPPYPVTFPHDYPYDNKSWYLDELRKNGSGKVVRREETS